MVELATETERSAPIIKQTIPGMGTCYYFNCSHCGEYNLLMGEKTGARILCTRCRKITVLKEKD